MLLLKCLRRLLLLGFASDSKLGRPTVEVAQCLPAMAHTLQQLLAARSAAAHTPLDTPSHAGQPGYPPATPPHAPGPARAPENAVAAARRSQLATMVDRGTLKLAAAHCQLQQVRGGGARARLQATAGHCWWSPPAARASEGGRARCGCVCGGRYVRAWVWGIERV